MPVKDTQSETQATMRALELAESLDQDMLGITDHAVKAQIATVWSLIAIHGAVNRLIDAINELPLETAADRIGLAITDPKG